MKQIRRRNPSFLYTLPFLSFAFILVMLASFLLASSGIAGVFSASLFNSPRGILLLVIVPLFLLGMAALLFYGLVSETLQASGGSRLRTRLFLSFCLVIFASGVPQTVVIGRFVGTALRTWFSSDVSGALRSVDDIAQLYVAERLHTAKRVSDRFLTGLSISNYRRKPTDWMSEMRAMDANAVACQVYLVSAGAANETNGAGADSPAAATLTPVVETGDSARFLPHARLDLVQNGAFALEGEDDLYRWGQTVRLSGATYVCVYTTAIPGAFVDKLASIRAASGQAQVIETLSPFLPLMGIWIYAIFCLPSILMLVLLAYALSARFADPVRSVAEAAARLAEGDSGFRVIPHGRDELAETALMLNVVAENAGSQKKADKKAVLRL